MTRSKSQYHLDVQAPLLWNGENNNKCCFQDSASQCELSPVSGIYETLRQRHYYCSTLGRMQPFSWVLEGPQDTQSCLFDLNKGFPGRKSTTDLSLIPNIYNSTSFILIFLPWGYIKFYIFFNKSPPFHRWWSNLRELKCLTCSCSCTERQWASEPMSLQAKGGLYRDTCIVTMQLALLQILILLPTYCVTLGKFINHSVPLFSY